MLGSLKRALGSPIRGVGEDMFISGVGGQGVAFSSALKADSRVKGSSSMLECAKSSSGLNPASTHIESISSLAPGPNQ